MNPVRQKLQGRSKPAGSPRLESAARAKRARDHLARKRERERIRLERARDREAIHEGRLRALAVLTPLLFVLALLLGVNTALPVSELLLFRGEPVKAVAVQGANALSPIAVAASAGALTGRSLASIDPIDVAATVAAEPWVESARTLRLPNGTLVVSIVERNAVARWRPDDATETELIDEKGVRFPGALETGGPLPLVRGQAFDPGEFPDEVLEILRELKRYAVLAKNPTALTLHLPGLVETANGGLQGSTAGYILELGEAGPRALLGRRLFSQRVARLATLLDEDEAMVQKARLIDLRYADRAVLRTEPAPG